MKPHIGILNFDNSRYFISKPNDIYWYRERFSFNAVLYLEESSKQRTRFYTICDELNVIPIYGLRINIRLSDVTDKRLEVIVCPKQNKDQSILDNLSKKEVEGTVSLDDILQIREQVRVGLTLGEGYIDIDSVCGVCRLLIRPDFVFLRYDLTNRVFYDDFWEGALWYLRENGVILILQRIQQKERWRYLFDDVEAVTEDGRAAFLRLFERETN